MISVLIVEDSDVVRDFLTYLIDSAPDMKVVRAVSSGEEALRFLQSRKPDVITMDIKMPGMNGIETTRRIMETTPVPIVVITASKDAYGMDTSFRALEAGALAVVDKPEGINHPNHEASVKQILKTLRLMSEVKVVTRRPRVMQKEVSEISQIGRMGRIQDARIISIGASTGGPPALKTIFPLLPEKFPVPILVVQHIAQGFIQGMVEWLQKSSPVPIHIATQGEVLLPGHIYFAPDDYQMGIDAVPSICLTDDVAYFGTIPSISYMFRSVQKVFGGRSVGILLSGMGKDGAEELLLMKEAGAVTVVQDRESSVVFGMPGEAVKINAARHIMTPMEIGLLLRQMAE